MLDNDGEGEGKGPDEGIRIVALCADCGCPMVAAHALFPVLCRACGDGMAALVDEQRRVLRGERTDWPGEDHIDAQCGRWSERRERYAPTIPELLSQLWDAWRWWFEGGPDEGVAA